MMTAYHYIVRTACAMEILTRVKNADLILTAILTIVRIEYVLKRNKGLTSCLMVNYAHIIGIALQIIVLKIIAMEI